MLESITGKLPKKIKVHLEFEYSSPETRSLLREYNHPTLVDVFFTARDAEKTLGYLLVEVKLSESSFGSCHGIKSTYNPNPSRCEHGAAVIGDNRRCWLTGTGPNRQGVKYWKIITQGEDAFNFKVLEKNTPCPFSSGLYQLMRNHALSKSLRTNTDAEWSYFAVCIHPKNQRVHHLKESIAGSRNIIESFRKLAGAKSVRELSPYQVIEMTEALYPSLSKWAAWMRKRYLLAA